MSVLPFTRPVVDGTQPPSGPPPKKSTAPKNSSRSVWGRILWVGISLGCVQLVVARPLINRLGGLEQRVADVDFDLMSLDARADDAQQVTSLLTSLRLQKNQLHEARAAVAEIQQLRQDIEVQARQVPEARAALQQFTELSTEIRRRDAERKREAMLHRPPVADMVDISHSPEQLPLPPAPEELRARKYMPEVVTMPDRWNVTIRPARRAATVTAVDSNSQPRPVLAAPSLITSDTETDVRQVR